MIPRVLHTLQGHSKGVCKKNILLNTSETEKAKKEEGERMKLISIFQEVLREENTSKYQHLMVLQPLLDSRAECAVRDKISVCKLEVRHR